MHKVSPMCPDRSVTYVPGSNTPFPRPHGAGEYTELAARSGWGGPLHMRNDVLKCRSGPEKRAAWALSRTYDAWRWNERTRPGSIPLRAPRAFGLRRRIGGAGRVHGASADG